MFWKRALPRRLQVNLVDRPNSSGFEPEARKNGARMSAGARNEVCFVDHCELAVFHHDPAVNDDGPNTTPIAGIDQIGDW